MFLRVLNLASKIIISTINLQAINTFKIFFLTKYCHLKQIVLVIFGKKFFLRSKIDFSAAISIDMFNSLSDKIRILEQVYGDGILALNKGEKLYSQYGPMKMAALVKSDLKIGHILSIKDISFKRTKQKTDLSQLDAINLIGKTLTKAISSKEVLNFSHFTTGNNNH